MDIKDWMPVTLKNGEVRRDIHVARIESDLLDAISMDERLAEINRGLPKKPAFSKEMQNKIDEEPYFIVTGIDFHPFNNNEKDS